MNRDDDIGRALRHLAAGVESNVRRPPARDIIRRAQHHPAGRLAEDTKPFPWAGIAGVAAIPFVAIGAVLVGPAGAGIIVGGADQAGSLPTAATSLASSAASAPVSSPGAVTPASPPAPTPEPTGQQAVRPLTEVMVAFTDEFADEQVRGTECRRLTTADRLIDSGDSVDDMVDATLAMLLEGPRPDEAAVGLSSPIQAGAATVSLDTAAMVVTVDVPDPAAWRDTCGPEEFQWALARTIGQFPGWSWTVIEAGVPLTPPTDLVAEVEGVPDGSPTDLSGPVGSAGSS